MSEANKNDCSWHKKYPWAFHADQVKKINMNIPIPLKNNCIVTISNLPVNLTKEQADHICGVIKALAI